MMNTTIVRISAPSLNRVIKTSPSLTDIIDDDDSVGYCDGLTIKPFLKNYGYYFCRVSTNDIIEGIRNLVELLPILSGIYNMTDAETLEFCNVVESLLDTVHPHENIVRNSFKYYGYHSLEAYILLQLLLRERDYINNGLDETLHWYNILQKTGFRLINESIEQLEVIDNHVIISWYTSTNFVRRTNIKVLNDLDSLGLQDRKRLIKTMEMI